MEHPRPTILLVEDNEDDVFIMKHALKKASVVNPLQVVTDGQMAIDYLAGKGSFSDRRQFPLPFVAFVDLKLPYLDGFEVLSWIQREEVANLLVAIVLTSSDEEKDHLRAYALGARSYVVKPPRADTLLEVFASLESYWSSKGENPLAVGSAPPNE
jgi:CheY-like chemotaxis protein